jgi:hypothetical protein
MAKKDPFPNDWDEVYHTDPEDFNTGPFDEVLDEVMQWHLPDPYVCVIRSYNPKSNKVREFAYKTESKAHKRIYDLANDNEHVTVLTQGIIGTINYTPN